VRSKRDEDEAEVDMERDCGREYSGREGEFCWIDFWLRHGLAEQCPRRFFQGLKHNSNNQRTFLSGKEKIVKFVYHNLKQERRRLDCK
jgi:hypothetical protein